MSSRASASRYARALFDVTAADSRAQVDQELTAVAKAFAAQADLQAVFASPSVAPAAKQAVVQAIIQKLGASTVVARLLTLLAQRDRLGLLQDIAAVFHERVLEDAQVLQAEVTTAQPLSDADRQALQARLSAATKKQVTITPRVESRHHRRPGGANRRHGIRRQSGQPARAHPRAPFARPLTERHDTLARQRRGKRY
jgi:F-type H+-transporting ATPase subunit delta